MEERPDNSLEELNTLEGYRQLFMDAAYWQPYIRLVCRRHGFPGCTVLTFWMEYLNVTPMLDSSRTWPNWLPYFGIWRRQD
jgi:hypothetical protein